MRMIRWFALIFAFVPSLAWAQAGVTTYLPGWGQTGYTTLSATSTSSNVLLPGSLTNGALANVCNTGSVDAFVLLGTSSAVVAVAAGNTSVRIPANNGCVPLPLNNQTTYLAGVTASASTSLIISVGSGTPFSSLPGGGDGTGGTCATLGGQLTGTCTSAVVGPSLVAGNTTTVIGQGAGGLLQGGAIQNTLGGYLAGASITTTTYVTLYGYQAGTNYVGTVGGNHALTAVGGDAGGSVTTAADVSAFGAGALINDDVSVGTAPITGSNLAGFGVHVMGHWGSGTTSVAVGNEAMVGCGAASGQPSCPLVTGGGHTALGDHALAFIQGAAAADTATGSNACKNLTTGSNMVCDGQGTGPTVQTSSGGILIGNPAHIADVPSDPTNNYLSIGGRIVGVMGTNLQFNDPITVGTWQGTSIAPAQGGTSSTASTASAVANGTTEVDIKNSAGGTIGIINSSSGGASPCGPVLSAGGGSTVQLNTNGCGTTPVLKTGEQTILSGGYTVSTLPAGTTGARAYVTDAVACTFLASLTGSGSTVCPVFYNGAAWVGG
jgi:hypothetical protein